jgi:hypothetical protein
LDDMLAVFAELYPQDMADDGSVDEAFAAGD